MKSKSKIWAEVGKPRPGYRKQTKIWTTGLGKKVRICDMSDQHLFNAARLLQRAAAVNHPKLIADMYSGYACLRGEMATYYAEQDIERAEREGPEGMLPDIYYNLIEELERRNLDAPKEI